MKGDEQQQSGGWVPLAERMRPRTLDAFVGQQHLLGPGRFLSALIENRSLRSLILWGPPGTGKTTLVRLYAEAVGAELVVLSAVAAGVRHVRETAEGARFRALRGERPTLLFVDEIHRFSKSQQDVLLPFVESGVMALVGATTENPSFELTNALRSRCRVLEVHPLSRSEIVTLLRRALEDAERGLGPTAPTLHEDAAERIAEVSDGDARTALGTLEVAADLAHARAGAGERGTIDLEVVHEALQRRSVRYDASGDQHFQNASAFIKSMRGSDPDAALFYMVRMLEAGEDPRFLLRRMIIFASEDIGNADPRALDVAVAAHRAFEVIGMPEGALAMTQAATYLSTAPKSNAALVAYAAARKAVLAHPNLRVPAHVAGSHRAAAEGAGYRYPHDFEGHYVPQRYLPERIRDHVYYAPRGEGYEARIVERLAAWTKRRREGEP
jgi:putative ATPase